MAKTLPEPAGLGRRFLSLIYEGLLVFAVLFFFSMAFQAVARDPIFGWTKHLFQFYLFLVIALYFIWSWLRGGQTLAMKTWKVKLQNTTGGAITPSQALFRYILACLSLMLGGSGFLWAFIDKDKQFLHDRLSATRIVMKRA